jgi:hypothetical protein
LGRRPDRLIPSRGRDRPEGIFEVVVLAATIENFLF